MSLWRRQLSQLQVTPDLTLRYNLKIHNPLYHRWIGVVLILSLPRVIDQILSERSLLKYIADNNIFYLKLVFVSKTLT